MRTFFTKSATVKRMSYTGDKSSYASQAVAVMGYFSPLDQDYQVEGIHTGSQAYKFTCEGYESILNTDVLTIDSVDYQVRGLRRYNSASLDLLDVLLERAVTA